MDEEFISKQIEEIIDEEMHKDNLGLSSVTFDNLDWFSDDLFENTIQVRIVRLHNYEKYS